MKVGRFAAQLTYALLGALVLTRVPSQAQTLTSQHHESSQDQKGREGAFFRI